MAHRKFNPGIVLAYIVLSIGAFSMAIPFIWMLSTAFKTPSQVFVIPPKWIPSPIITDNFKKLFSLMPFGRYYFNSIFVSVTGTLGRLLLAILTAYAFSWLEFPGRDKIFILYLATMMIPFHVRLVPMFLIMRALRWLDTYYVLIIPGLFSVYAAFLLRQFFLGIHRDLIDAATIDGCNSWTILWRIVVPLSTPAIGALGIFTFLDEWNSFMWPLIMTSSNKMRVIPVGLAFLQDQYYTDYTILMAGAVLALVPVIIVFLAFQRYFVRGIVLSGLKE
jgi:multiple sugar transport system permease protein